MAFTPTQFYIRGFQTCSWRPLSCRLSYRLPVLIKTDFQVFRLIRNLQQVCWSSLQKQDSTPLVYMVVRNQIMVSYTIGMCDQNMVHTSVTYRGCITHMQSDTQMTRCASSNSILVPTTEMKAHFKA